MSKWLDIAKKGVQAPALTPPGELYFTYTNPSGDEFIAPASNWENYVANGAQVTGEIENINEWMTQHAEELKQQATEAAKSAARSSSSSSTAAPTPAA